MTDSKRIAAARRAAGRLNEELATNAAKLSAALSAPMLGEAELAALAYLQRVEQAAEILGTEIRVTVHYKGFGSGGTAGVTPAGARRFVERISADQKATKGQHGVGLKSISIECSTGMVVPA